jgi:hypothetical protein
MPTSFFNPNYLIKIGDMTYYNEAEDKTHLFLELNDEYISSALMAWDTVVNQAPVQYTNNGGGALTGN